MRNPFVFGTYTDGENSPNAHLTDDVAAEVLLLVRAGWRNREIVQRMGISRSQVSSIKTRRTWTHIRLADRFTPSQLEAEIKQRMKI